MIFYFCLAFCYLLWGLFPIYWKMLKHIPPSIILQHRIVWSFIFYSIVLFAKNKTLGSWRLNKFKFKENIGKLIISSICIVSNWYLYIYAVNSNQIMQGSFAYYLSPILTVLIGVLIYKEEVNRLILASIGLCGIGLIVFAQSMESGQWPWLSLSLAITFCGYGWSKKQIKIPPLNSSLIESAVFVIPILINWFFYQTNQFAQLAPNDLFFLILGGVITGIPLLLFSIAAQNLKMSSIGMFQYISPTIQLLTAVLIYSEPLKAEKITAFILIWFGVGFYLYNLKNRQIKT